MQISKPHQGNKRVMTVRPGSIQATLSILQPIEDPLSDHFH